MSVCRSALSRHASNNGPREEHAWVDLSPEVLDTAGCCLDIAMRTTQAGGLRKGGAVIAQIEIPFRFLHSPQSCYGSVWLRGTPSLNSFGPQNPQIPTCFAERSEYLISQRLTGGQP